MNVVGRTPALDRMRISYITAGAAGMFCGSCLHDNTLVASLIKQGHDAILVPTYTPIRTDEKDISDRHLFLGGINVYLQQKVPLFRKTPWFLDRILDSRWLLRLASRFAARTRAEELGDLTISILKGLEGNQRKEVEKLVWWLETQVRPNLINLTNVLLSGLVPAIKERLRVPVLATLQGDDVFLEALPENHRGQALALIRRHCRSIDGFIATSRYYADFMAEYLGIARDRIDVVYPGINVEGFTPRACVEGDGPFTVGYLARICPEKGLHNLVRAVIAMKRLEPSREVQLRVSGWLGDDQREYLEGLQEELAAAGLSDNYRYVPTPDHASKVRFLQSLHALSVPTTYREPKGLYVLESWATRLPVVQPAHGSFPELIEMTGGGLLVEPENPEALAEALARLAADAATRADLGARGRQAVETRFCAEAMATGTVAVYRKYL